MYSLSIKFLRKLTKLLVAGGKEWGESKTQQPRIFAPTHHQKLLQVFAKVQSTEFLYSRSYLNTVCDVTFGNKLNKSLDSFPRRLLSKQTHVSSCNTLQKE